ncbi:pyridoxal phosphate-dependent aminotransferase [Paractinoplanes hotanensis]|uniref:Aminotransferase class I/II-fold pyridoxal phosphate-dependent enzyme n=1 Tax=Paractinoplanes hotanensis TaxID=2906497 RepID=A0ABT0XTK5_9ACTN|nr:pyridoxal phosphate-dependent aminotransferase [Actinoplanes hotanensis]MCM4076474.1 aminotransferase class I/II-fold pyridoxal phosphate-dependent enzyme [Actinoplanes hotanensis]
MEQFTNLTRYERVSLGLPFNLADGHARQYQDQGQIEISDRLPELYRASESVALPALEREFQRIFFALAGQDTAMTHERTLLSPSASMSTDLIATCAGYHGWSVALVQPCFDNLAAIMARRRVAMVPVREEDLTATTLHLPPADALLLTLPNNPTGFLLDPSQFRRLALHCRDTGTVLILDWTFRFFSTLSTWDQYAVLEECGVSYVCVEDTGKTWPSVDLKCSILATSADIYLKLLDVHNDVLLNVSPFVLMLLVEYLRDSGDRGLDATVRQPVLINRNRLRATLRGTILAPVTGRAPVSVEWVRINSPVLQSSDVVTWAADSGIGILPGDHFFWFDPDPGRKFVRFALARDPANFAQACERLEGVLSLIQNSEEGPVVA